MVVICFHFTTFAVLETAVTYCCFVTALLWFAFILLPLPYWKQHFRRVKAGQWSCDLLSFYYLCRTGNSITTTKYTDIDVVICFHFTTFAVLETAKANGWPLLRRLWFAFILLPLPYWKQPVCPLLACWCRCDLLSFYYLCRTGNSGVHRNSLRNYVVICFHFTTFAVLETAEGLRARQPLRRCDLLSFYYLCRTGNSMKNRWLLASELWFAFILLPLPYWKQPYICPFPFRQVVICFHFTTFAVLETASRYFNLGCIELWFAFILLPLPYWKQRTCWRGSGSTSCDLLSFYYLCRTGNSRLWTASPRWRVVICFHFTTFAVLETA